MKEVIGKMIRACEWVEMDMWTTFEIITDQYQESLKYLVATQLLWGGWGQLQFNNNDLKKNRELII